MTNFKTRCGFIGCEPISGQCLGFCENAKTEAMSVNFSGPEPVESGFSFPEVDQEPDDDFRGGMQMLAGMVAISAIVFFSFLIYFFFVITS